MLPNPAQPHRLHPPPAAAQVLIDDNPQYAQDCAEAGLQVLLYDWQLAYPWSKLPPSMQHPNITVVSDWQDVEDRLRALALAQAQP